MPATTGAEMRTLMNAARKPGQRLDADVAQRAVALDGQGATGGEGEEADDHDGSADHRQCARAHGDLGDQPDDLLTEVHSGVWDARQRPRVEQDMVADLGEEVDWPSGFPEQPRIYRLYRHRRYPVVIRMPMAVTSTLITNSAMNAYTTVSLTALPTALAPPPLIVNPR